MTAQDTRSAEKSRVLYIGEDKTFLLPIYTALAAQHIKVDDFFGLHLSFAMLPQEDYQVAIVDCDYKAPLLLIETIRSSHKDDAAPYILLVGTVDQIQAIKPQFNLRNYPDDICLKNSDLTHMINYVLYCFLNVEEPWDDDTCPKNAICGELSETSYGKLLWAMHQDAFTGKLVLHSKPDKAVFFFYRGEPLNIIFNRIQFTLGRMLLKQGIIDEAKYLHSLEIMILKNIKQGDALIEIGAISPSNIVDHIIKQQMEKQLYFFSRTIGQFRVIPCDVDPARNVAPKRNLFSLIYDGVMQYTPQDVLMKKFIPMKDRFVVLTDQYVKFRDQFPFTAEEHRFLQSFAGSFPVFSEVVDKAHLDFVRVLQLFEVLETCSMLAFATTQKEAEHICHQADPGTIRVKEAILRDHVEIAGKNYYEILGVDMKCNVQDIKKRYIEMAKDYHPDHFSHMHLGQDLIRKVAETFQVIQTAYQVLSNEETRKNYDLTVASPYLADMLKKSEDIVNAEFAFKKGEMCLKRKNFRDAEIYLRDAVRLNDKEPDYLLNLGIALLFLKVQNNDPRDMEAKKFIEKAIYINPYFDRAYYYLGVWNKLRGDMQNAVLCFKKTLSINPDNRDAQRELNAAGNSQ